MSRLMTIKCSPEEYSVYTEYARSIDLSLSQLVRHSLRVYMQSRPSIDAPHSISPVHQASIPSPEVETLINSWD